MKNFIRNLVFALKYWWIHGDKEVTLTENKLMMLIIVKFLAGAIFGFAIGAIMYH